MYANLLPLACLLLDMIINKVKIKVGHYWFVMLLTGLYFAGTAFFEWNHDYSIYPENLNWFCRYNLSYLYKNDATKHTMKKFRDLPCPDPSNPNQNNTVKAGYVCKDLLSNFYCPAEMLLNNTDAEYFKA